MATPTPQERSASTDWQTNKGTVRERTAFLFNNSLMSDITFVLTDPDGTQVRVPAHKLVLAISSPVFEAMFYGELTEKGEIELPDTQLHYLLEFLRFLYCDEVELTTDNAFGVLYLAQKYIVPSLADKCWAFIDKNTCACLESDNAVSTFNSEMLTSLAKRDTLQINKELELFEAMKHWAQKRCKAEGLEPSGKAIRRALGDVMNLFRWPAISQLDFAQHVVPTGILTGEESLDVYEYYSRAPAARERRFCEIYRGGAFADAELQECCREVVSFSSSTSSEKEEVESKLELVVQSRNVYLKGIQLMTQVEERKDKARETITADVRLLDGDGEELAARTGNFREALVTIVKRTSLMEYYVETKVISVQFKNPVLIWKGLKYTLIVKLRCPAGKSVPEHATFANRASSFEFEGSCPVSKLFYYKLASD